MIKPCSSESLWDNLGMFLLEAVAIATRNKDVCTEILILREIWNQTFRHSAMVVTSVKKEQLWTHMEANCFSALLFALQCRIQDHYLKFREFPQTFVMYLSVGCHSNVLCFFPVARRRKHGRSAKKWSLHSVIPMKNCLSLIHIHVTTAKANVIFIYLFIFYNCSSTPEKKTEPQG